MSHLVTIVPTFSKAQRAWIIGRDKGQCQFRWKKNGVWVQCPNSSFLHVHHIRPRGYILHNYPKEYDANDCLNLIVLCRFHHICYGQNPKRLVGLHPDNEIARLQYRAGNKEAFKEMALARQALAIKGLPYWNTQWDSLFMFWVNQTTPIYSKYEPYPPSKYTRKEKWEDD